MRKKRVGGGYRGKGEVRKRGGEAGKSGRIVIGEGRGEMTEEGEGKEGDRMGDGRGGGKRQGGEGRGRKGRGWERGEEEGSNREGRGGEGEKLGEGRRGGKLQREEGRGGRGRGNGRRGWPGFGAGRMATAWHTVGGKNLSWSSLNITPADAKSSK